MRDEGGRWTGARGKQTGGEVVRAKVCSATRGSWCRAVVRHWMTGFFLSKLTKESVGFNRRGYRAGQDRMGMGRLQRTGECVGGMDGLRRMQQGKGEGWKCSVSRTGGMCGRERGREYF